MVILIARCSYSITFCFLTDNFTRGIYAISVSGRLPKGVIREMKNRGIPYRQRDTSQR